VKSPQTAVNRARAAWAVSGALSLAWVVLVLAGDLWARVAGQWESAVTMLFGSFLAGSSPEGGGAVAFPVFTKALQVPGPVARSFGLSIQAVGMGVAALAIVLNGRVIHVRAAVIGSLAGIVGFLIGLYGFSHSGEVFWPSEVPVEWVKATFSIVLATTSVMMIRQLRPSGPIDDPLEWNRRLDVCLVLVAAAGGALASMTGTGANIVIFLFLVLLADVNPKVALPTVVVVMAMISLAGTVIIGIVHGNLFVEVVGDRVVSVGGLATDLPADRNDLLALWLAAVPVVVWGAPLGSWVAAKVRESQLVGFVALLAATEVVTTFILVRELRTDPALLTYLVAGLLILPSGLILLRRARHRVFRPAPLRYATSRRTG
jgi:uncharacterized protein